MTGHLWRIVQRHLDAYGVRAATLAKRMGTSPQTLDSWKHRGVRALPSRELLEALSAETRTPYAEVLAAALRDIGYLPPEQVAPVAPAPTSTDELVQRYLAHAIGSGAVSTTGSAPELIADILRTFAAEVVARSGEATPGPSRAEGVNR